MKTSRTVQLIATATLAGWAVTAQAQGSQAQGSQENTGSENQPAGSQAPTAMAGRLITATAKVDKVDADKRELTLKADNNKPFTINVPENVTRLDNVKPGDQLRVSFYESVAVSLAKAGEARPGMESTTSAGRTQGTLPGGGIAQQVTTTAKITKVAPSKDELTIQGPSGKETTIKVDDPQVRSQLGRLKVGDRIQTTYTQAMATSVTPARAM